MSYTNPCRIGITCHLDTVTSARQEQEAYFTLNRNYANRLLEFGATPFLLPYMPKEHIESVVDNLDGLIISGGDFDVPPDFYKQEKLPECGKIVEERSVFERALCIAALEFDLPLLGVCGGMQLLNVVCGGSLYQDNTLRPDTNAHQQDAPKNQTAHALSVEENSLLHALVKTKSLEVNSTHHQIIDKVSKHLRVSAKALDGVIEAIEMPGKSFVLGVQWHPEALDHDAQKNIYRGFVQAAMNRQDF